MDSPPSHVKVPLIASVYAVFIQLLCRCIVQFESKPAVAFLSLTLLVTSSLRKHRAERFRLFAQSFQKWFGHGHRTTWENIRKHHSYKKATKISPYVPIIWHVLIVCRTERLFTDCVDLKHSCRVLEGVFMHRSVIVDVVLTSNTVCRLGLHTTYVYLACFDTTELAIG